MYKIIKLIEYFDGYSWYMICCDLLTDIILFETYQILRTIWSVQVERSEQRGMRSGNYSNLSEQY